jgi:hypothetical protein
MAEARGPRPASPVALSYAASFVARADLAVVVGFMTLWIVDYATTERGAGPLLAQRVPAGVRGSGGTLVKPVART